MIDFGGGNYHKSIANYPEYGIIISMSKIWEFENEAEGPGEQ